MKLTYKAFTHNPAHSLLAFFPLKLKEVSFMHFGYEIVTHYQAIVHLAQLLSYLHLRHITIVLCVGVRPCGTHAEENGFSLP